MDTHTCQMWHEDRTICNAPNATHPIVLGIGSRLWMCDVHAEWTTTDGFGTEVPIELQPTW